MKCFTTVVKMARGIVAIIFVLATISTSYALTAEEQTEIEKEYDAAGAYDVITQIAEEVETEVLVLKKIKTYVDKKRAEFKDVELSPEKDILIEEIMANFDFEHMFSTTMLAMLKEIKTMISEADITQYMHEDTMLYLNSNETKKLIVSLGPIFQDVVKDTVKRSFKNVYGEYYTQDELKVIADFYRTSAGRKSANIPSWVYEKAIETSIAISPIDTLPIMAKIEKLFNDYSSKIDEERMLNKVEIRQHSKEHLDTLNDTLISLNEHVKEMREANPDKSPHPHYTDEEWIQLQKEIDNLLIRNNQ